MLRSGVLSSPDQSSERTCAFSAQRFFAVAVVVVVVVVVAAAAAVVVVVVVVVAIYENISGKITVVLQSGHRDKNVPGLTRVPYDLRSS